MFLGVGLSRSKPSSAPDPFASVRALWRNRHLWWQFTLRNVELRHKGSHLGLIWSLLNPLLMLSLYVFIFGYIFNGRFQSGGAETKLEYALGIFLGLTIFQLFAETLAVSPTVIVTNPNLVKKVVFPLEILPAAAVGSSVFHTLISLCLVLLGIAWLGPGLTLHAAWLPLILAPLILAALGLAWLFAAIGVFLRDINQVIGFFSMALLYSSATFYSPTVLPPTAWMILRFNPILLAIDLSRDAVMWHQPLNMHHLSYLIAISLIICVGGLAFFRKMSPAFADVL